MIVIADPHLGLESDSIILEGYLPSKLVDTRDRIYEAIDAASVDDKCLVIAGDIFNTPNPKAYVVSQFLLILRYAKEKLVRVIIIPGNHDSDTRCSNVVIAESSNYKNVKVVTEPKFIWGVFFLPHMPKSVESKLELDYGSILREAKVKDSIVISHAVVQGAKVSSEQEMEAGTALVWNLSTFPKCKLALLGHIHRHQALSGPGYEIVYPGSVPVCNFGEVDEIKGYLQVDLDSASWTFHPFKTKGYEYKQININLLKKDSLDLNEDKIEKVAKNKLLKIVVYAKDLSQVNEAEIRKAFDKYGKVVRFGYEICKDKTSNRVEVDEEAILSSIDHFGLLKTYVSSLDLKPDFANGLVTLGKEIMEECLTE